MDQYAREIEEENRLKKSKSVGVGGSRYRASVQSSNFTRKDSTTGNSDQGDLLYPTAPENDLHEPQGENDDVHLDAESSTTMFQAVYVDPTDEAHADAILRGEADIEFNMLDIEDDDLDTVTDEMRLDFCLRLFNAITAEPAAAPAGMDETASAHWDAKQQEALKLCEQKMGDQYATRFVSASCAKVYHNAVSLHTKGIPSYQVEKGGKRSKAAYKLDLNSKFTVRMEKIIDAIATHKRVAFDLVTNQPRLEHLVRGPAAYIKRMADNHIGNEKKGIILKEGQAHGKGGNATTKANKLAGNMLPKNKEGGRASMANPKFGGIQDLQRLSAVGTKRLLAKEDDGEERSSKRMAFD